MPAASPRGASLGIGDAYVISPFFDDLSFTYTLSNGDSGGGFVIYSGDAPARSDLNVDGVIDRADWGIFLANNATDLSGDLPVVAYSKGDLDLDLDNDFNDYLLFRSDFIAANGAAAFAALSAVPEPSALMLTLLFLAAAASPLRRSQSGS